MNTQRQPYTDRDGNPLPDTGYVEFDPDLEIADDDPLQDLFKKPTSQPPAAPQKPPAKDASFKEEEHPRASGGATAGRFVKKGQEGAPSELAQVEEVTEPEHKKKDKIKKKDKAARPAEAPQPVSISGERGNRRRAAQSQIENVIKSSFEPGHDRLSTEEASKVAGIVADFFDYAPAHKALIKMLPGHKYFFLNGEQHESGGSAYTLGQEGRVKGTIEMYHEATNPFLIAENLAHEITHIRWQTVFDAYMAEKEAPAKRTELHAALEPLIGSNEAIRKLIEGDGITEYSEEYWKGYGNDKSIPLRSAFHETLAEMGRLDWLGPNVVDFGDKPALRKNTKTWKPLYDAVQKFYPTLTKTAAPPNPWLPVEDVAFREEEHPRSREGGTAGQFVKKGEEGGGPSPAPAGLKTVTPKFTENLSRYGFNYARSATYGHSQTHDFERKMKGGDRALIQVYSGPDEDPEKPAWLIYKPGEGQEPVEGKGWDELRQALKERGLKPRSLEPPQKASTAEQARQFERSQQRGETRARVIDILNKPGGMSEVGILDIASEIGDFFNYSDAHKNRIRIERGRKEFKVGDKTHIYAGAAWTRGDRRGDIAIYNDVVEPHDVEGVIAHEINHIMWQTVLDAYHRDRLGIHKRSGEAGFWDKDGVMAPDGSLRDTPAGKAAQQQYPIYARLQPVLADRYSQFERDDGLTDYSREWWQAVNDGKAARQKAEHETLAEMGRLDYEGSLQKLLWYKDSDSWKPLYLAVQDLYPKIAKEGYGYHEPLEAGAGGEPSLSPAAPRAPERRPRTRPASAKLASAIVQAGGAGTARDVAVVHKQLSRMPEKVLQALKDGAWNVTACRGSITDVLSHLKGVTPRGWPPTMTWDNVPGICSISFSQVVVATRDGKVPEIGNGHGCVNLVMHETLHAYDDVNKLSRSTEFTKARAADLDEFDGMGWLGAYMKQPPPAGEQETFAETGAMYLSRQWPTGKMPNLYQYWFEHFDEAAA